MPDNSDDVRGTVSPDVKAVFLDCDGTLVDSEPHAFRVCCRLANETLEAKGLAPRYSERELMSKFVGSSFRELITRLSAEHGFALDRDELERLVAREDEEVTASLVAGVAAADGALQVCRALAAAGKYRLAVVSSSSMPRVRACLAKIGLDDVFPPGVVFSATSSLVPPKSKPHPDVYLFAVRETRATAAVALEDSVNGTKSAAGAAVTVVGFVGLVRPNEQDELAARLRAAGATEVIRSWGELPAVLERLL